MKTIPFYSNNEDNMRCMVAIYRTLFEYFLGKKTLPGEMEEFVGYKDGRAAWTLKPLTAMMRKGFDIKMIEPFDYEAYAKDGIDYLAEAFGPEKADWILEHSNILDIKPSVPEFLRTIKPQNRRATLGDIDEMLAENRLIFVTLNSRILNNKEGYVEHSILILQRKGSEYIAHDPGLPPQPYRHISRELLWQAMGGDQNTSEVVGFMLAKAHSHRRLDRYVLAQKPRISRAYAAKLIEQGRVLVNGKINKPGYKLHHDDQVTIDYDESELDDIPKIDLPILYEDSDCVVINKPAGVLTHAQNNLIAEGTVATFLRDRVNDDSLGGDRAGIVHRLDRATSGVIVGAKNEVALSWLQKQFADRKAKKTYAAIVEGRLKQPEAIIDMPIERNPKSPATFRVGANGKASVTHYKVLRETDRYSLVELKPSTGRTHQLRVHLAELGHPIVGDPLYGSGKPYDRLFLHAESLELTLPSRETRKFSALIPEEFEELLANG